ncbi:MAG: hypothetical protein IT495_22555 [Gammaproteobacteria bacterium]|nr:hypothetical protein [Gammaproteobacteria bacterium]
MTAARAAFAALLARQPAGRPLWAPLVDTLAARLAGVSYRQMCDEPGLWVAGLQRAAELLDADAIIAPWDATLMAEACGAQTVWDGERPRLVEAPAALPAEPAAASRQAVALETLRRLRSGPGAQAAVIAALIGPATLAAQLLPGIDGAEGLKQVKAIHARVTEEALKARPDMVLFVEQRAHADPAGRPLQRGYATLRNLAAYYDVPAALRLDGWGAGDIGALAQLKLDLIVLGTGAADGVAAAGALGGAMLGAGASIPIDDPARARQSFGAAAVAAAAGLNLLVTTCEPVDPDQDLAELRALIAALRAA